MTVENTQQSARHRPQNTQSIKAVFISYNQILDDRAILIMDRLNIRGYSKWELTHGRGSVNGEPHMGSHAWPSMNSSAMAVVPDEKVEPFLEALRRLDAMAPHRVSGHSYGT